MAELKLRCPDCHREMVVKPDLSDPKGTVIVECTCDNCDDAGGFPETHYYDADGRWFNGEQFVPLKSR
jgi:hypothetical protein